MMDVTGKVAIVTGGTSGIGKGIAIALANAGGKVIVVGMPTEEVCVQAAKDISAECGVEVIGHKLDIANEQEVVEFVAQMEKEHGRVDILVNNAGIQIIEKFEDFTSEKWHSLLNINLHGSFYISRECFKLMKKNDFGRVVNIGSVHSFVASTDKAAYVAGKHAMVGLTRTIATEGGPFNISCNLVAPGFVLTPLVEKQIPERARLEGITEEEVMKSMTHNTIDGQFTTVEEVADAVLFFASAKSNAYSGQDLIVSHGWNMR